MEKVLRRYSAFCVVFLFVFCLELGGAVSKCTAKSCNCGPVTIKPFRPADVKRGSEVVTENGQPAYTVALASLKSAGPGVQLALSYQPGYPSPWTNRYGEPFLGKGWNYTFPCLVLESQQDGEGGDGTLPQGIPEKVVMVFKGVARSRFVRQQGSTVYTSRRFPNMQMKYLPAGDVFELRDSEGNTVSFAGFTNGRPEPQRGKPLCFEDPYFTGERGVRFIWTGEGTLEQVRDTAGRVWRFLYREGLAWKVVVTNESGFVLKRVEFLYGKDVESANAGERDLAAVRASVEGLPGMWTCHAFGYQGEGSDGSFLKCVMGPSRVAGYGGAVEALALETEEFARASKLVLDYRLRDSLPRVVVSALKLGGGCACGSGESGWFSFSYRFNETAGGSGDWAVCIEEKNPAGGVTISDYNCYGRIINWARSTCHESTMVREYYAYGYDQHGRLTFVVYPFEGYFYSSAGHKGVFEEKGAEGSGLVRRFIYDEEGRVTKEQICKAEAFVFSNREAKDGIRWITLNSYSYKDKIPWPTLVCEYPRKGGEPVKTRIEYEFSGPARDLRLIRKVETLPVVTLKQNGSGRAEQVVSVYDEKTGLLLCETGPSGVATEYLYDDSTGVLIEEIEAPDSLGSSTKWYLDPWGEVTKKEFPGGLEEFTFKAALNDQEIAFLSYKKGEPALRSPVEITVKDLAGKVLGKAKGIPRPGLLPEEAVSEGAGGIREAWQGVLGEVTEYSYGNGKRVAVSRVENSGRSVSSRYTTRFFYDEAGRKVRRVACDGTIVQKQYDAFGRLLRTFEGVEPDGEDFTLTEKRYYDSCGRLSGIRAYSSDPGEFEEAKGTLTAYSYDWRGRLREKVPGGEETGEPAKRIRYTYDNLDRVTGRLVCPVGGGSFRPLETMVYDSRGRVCQRSTWSLEDTGEKAVESYWYGRAGRRTKVLFPGGSYRKKFYDRLGRPRAVYMGFDPGDTGSGPQEAYEEAVSTSGLQDDVVLEGEEFEYSAAGNVILQKHIMRLETAEGPGVSTERNLFRTRQAGVWYDSLGRKRHAAVLSSERGIWKQRPRAVPLSSSSVRRMDWEYDKWGRLRKVCFPDGRVVEREYDSLGRIVERKENGGFEEDENAGVLCSRYTYDGRDRIVRKRVVFDTCNGRRARETEYVFGVRKSGKYPSRIETGRLLREIRHPDPRLGKAADRPQCKEIFAYDAQGRIILHRGKSDDSGKAVVHEYEYDTLGRPVTDSVTEVSSNTDTRVLSVGYSYDRWHRRERVTTYTLPWKNGEIINEVHWKYNGFGQVVASFQEHQGACTDRSMRVGYVWGGIYNKKRLSRLSSLLYPSARGEGLVLNFHYGNGGEGISLAERADRVLGRVSRITSPDLEHRILAEYGYRGLNTALERRTQLAWPGFFIKEKRHYDGFGNTSRLRTRLCWGDYSILDLHDFRYSYDAASRIKSESDRAMPANGGTDEVRIYDGLGRLVTSAQGSVSNGVLRNVKNVRQWKLSGTGNWQEYYSGGKTERREHNALDQITNSGEHSGFSYDACGNTLRAYGRRFIYDAWNRLVGFKRGDFRCSIERDGIGRPVREKFSGGGSERIERQLYYRKPWQLLTVIEKWGDTEKREDYVWGVARKDELLMCRRRENGRIENLFYLQDARRNVTTVCNDLGLPVERYRYSPYGKVRIWDGWYGNERTVSRTGNPFRFHTRRLCGVGGEKLYDFRFRAYMPRLGRFLQRDPLGIPFKGNLYSSPFGSSLLDPNGLKPQLRDCTTKAFPLRYAAGMGVVFKIEGRFKNTVCDCCAKKRGWIERGWEESSITGSMSVGVGVVFSIGAWGIDVGFAFEAAQIKLAECEGKIVWDACERRSERCMGCSIKAAAGIPVVEISGLIASVRGDAQVTASAGIKYCLEGQKIKQTLTVCSGWHAGITFRFFWFSKTFEVGAPFGCIKKEL